MKVSFKEIRKAIERDRPGFWAERTLNRTRKQYEELYQPNTEEDKTKTNDPSMLSLAHFIIMTFGNDNLAKTMSFLDSISDKEEERLMRVAHFFYHMGRNHERSFFK